MQVKKSPFNLDIRQEVKFTIPDGQVFPQSWCRPQNDGPGLRALTFIK